MLISLSNYMELELASREAQGLRGAGLALDANIHNLGTSSRLCILHVQCWGAACRRSQEGNPILATHNIDVHAEAEKSS